jgi:hypothetical protein
VIPAASLVRVSSFPSLRSPVSAARTLCACQPVAPLSSLIGAPSGRCSKARMTAFFDRRIDVPAPAFAESDSAGFVVASMRRSGGGFWRVAGSVPSLLLTCVTWTWSEPPLCHGASRRRHRHEPRRLSRLGLRRPGRSEGRGRPWVSTLCAPEKSSRIWLIAWKLFAWPPGGRDDGPV